MNFFDFFKEKIYVILVLFFLYFHFFLLFMAFKISFAIQLFFFFCSFFVFLFLFFFEFFRKKHFYDALKEQIASLKKAYLVLETLNRPNFLEGRILYDVLHDINKSMCEEVKKLEFQKEDFRDYIEMWIHEVKIPIASFLLMAHNKKEKFDPSELEQIRKIENYVEQVLYYSRCENASVDYFIKEVSLSKVVSEVALKNKDDLLENKIDFICNVKNKTVYTDSKWLIFIVNQLVNNSIKYRKQTGSSFIKIFTTEDSSCTKLVVLDNGIGIIKNDIRRVFEKTFTGFNGRSHASSTGMGLFIAKSLCEKLGHKIEIESVVGEYTKAVISFSKNTYYEVLRK